MLFNLDPATIISRIIILLISLSVHEFAHAWTADRFGDNTPRINGRLTLNPLAHLDPIGTLMFIIAGFGFAKPVPVNAYALRRREFMWVALAGPLSNLLLAILGAILFRIFFYPWGGVFTYPGTQSITFLPSLVDFLWYFITINIVLMLFNLIPLYPLDGEKVLDGLAPITWQNQLARIRPYGPMILLGLVFLGPVIGLDILNLILVTPMIFLRRLLLGL